MAKELTPKQKRTLLQARKLAKDAGKDWKELSTSDRRAYRIQARKPAADAGAVRSNSPRSPKAIREKAREAAAVAGKNWGDLSAQERKTYVEQVRKRT